MWLRLHFDQPWRDYGHRCQGLSPVWPKPFSLASALSMLRVHLNLRHRKHEKLRVNMHGVRIKLINISIMSYHSISCILVLLSSSHYITEPLTAFFQYLPGLKYLFFTAQVSKLIFTSYCRTSSSQIPQDSRPVTDFALRYQSWPTFTKVNEIQTELFNILFIVHMFFNLLILFLPFLPLLLPLFFFFEISLSPET